MEWAQQQAIRIADEENAVRQNRESRLLRAEIVKNDAPTLFENLAGQIERCVAEVNFAIGEVRLQCEREPGYIALTQQRIPQSSLRLRHRETLISVKKRTVVRYPSTMDTEWVIDYTIDENNKVSLAGSSGLEDAAQRLIEKII